MNILHVVTKDTGGAFNAAYRLHRGLLSESVESKVLTLHRSGSVPDVIKYTRNSNPEPPSLSDKIARKIWPAALRDERASLTKLPEGPVKGELFSTSVTTRDILDADAWQWADIIHLHWVSGFLDYQSFFDPRRNTKPVVWTLHDMNPFTGGCHYSEGCIGYRTKCQNCPMLNETANPDFAAQILKDKYRSLKRFRKLHIVTPSRWLGKHSSSGKLFHNYPHSVIPYGLNDEIYHTREQKNLRKKLGLPQNKRLVLFVAENLNNRRKGFNILLDALNKPPLDSRSDVRYLAVGESAVSQELIHTLGPVHDDHHMAEIYAAADLFVIPSLEDNLPNTPIEAIMCGTPAVGFPSGGLSEIIRHGRDGILCREKSATALADGIHEALDRLNDFDPQKLHVEAVERFGFHRQAQEMLEVYEQMLE